MIAPDIIQKVKDSANIVQIISEYVGLKKQGAIYKGSCPFHSEKTDSFVVSPAKRIYKCFGCGVSGSAIDFVMAHERLTFVEALRLLGNKVGVDVPERQLSPEEVAAVKKREAVFTSLENEAKNYQQNLTAVQIQYLQKRGFTETDIQTWRVGFSTSGYFYNRITFPIQDFLGKVRGFTGRVTDGSEPKYKNSAESDTYKKSELLYGLFQARTEIVKKNKAYLVEGQTDCIAMHRAEIRNTVAGSGTALSEAQAKLLRRYTTNVCCVYDNDANQAGQKAAIKSIAILLAADVYPTFVLLPAGDDPDSLIARGENMNTLLANELNFIQFRLSVLGDNINDMKLRSDFVSATLAEIAMIPDKELKRTAIIELSRATGISENEMITDVRKLRADAEKPEHDGFFAFTEAAEAIRAEKTANITSDLDAVIQRHIAGNSNYVGINGNILSKDAIKELKKTGCKKLFFHDEIKPETTLMQNALRMFRNGFDINIISADNVDEETGEVTTDFCGFVDYYINILTEKINPTSTDAISNAIERTAEILSFLPESSRIAKIISVQNAFKNAKIKFNLAGFNRILKSYLQKNAKFITDKKEIDVENNMNLSPEQLEDMNSYQHFVRKNSIWYSNGGAIQRISNFNIIPIIHSNTSSGHFKLFQIENVFGVKTTIHLTTKDLNDLRAFKVAVEGKGNFIFKGNQQALDCIKERLYANTLYSEEIEILGWQPQEFWAWADGVTTPDGKYKKVNENGLIEIAKQNYMIKPYSQLFRNDRTAYVNEKKFKHITSKVTFNEWANMYYRVFGRNAIIGICAYLTTIYSDYIFNAVHGELPMINYFGPKGTGKTQQADSLLAFFGQKQPINNLSKVTQYALSQILKSFNNAFIIVDEYKNSLPMPWIEFLKSIYNRQGKTQGNWTTTGTSKSETTPINSMVLLCGQDLPTLDVALLERCLCLTTSKTSFTDAEKLEYNELKDIELQGLTHITDLLIAMRPIIKERFKDANDTVAAMVSEKTGEVTVRLQKNLSTILTPFYILENHINMPFSFQNALDFGIEIIKEQQKFILSSDDLKNFWTIFQTLYEQKRIYEGRNYLIQEKLELNLIDKDPIIYKDGVKILYLRWSGLYPLYAEYARRSGMAVLGDQTILFYLTKRSYYLGKERKKNFKDKLTGEHWCNDAYVFNYTDMGIDLMESDSSNVADSDNNSSQTGITDKSGDELPF
jgi:DNA primase